MQQHISAKKSTSTAKNTETPRHILRINKEQTKTVTNFPHINSKKEKKNTEKKSRTPRHAFCKSIARETLGKRTENQQNQHETHHHNPQANRCNICSNKSAREKKQLQKNSSFFFCISQLKKSDPKTSQLKYTLPKIPAFLYVLIGRQVEWQWLFQSPLVPQPIKTFNFQLFQHLFQLPQPIKKLQNSSFFPHNV